jgi:hypothetical protein
MSTELPGGVIRITKEEATSSHVDDLLKRQMSLRGEPGVTRERGRKWYYQTWLVLMIVGALGALAAWAILDPIYTDYLYFQGPISAVHVDTERLVPEERSGSSWDSTAPLVARLTVRGETIYMLPTAREIQSNGRKRRVVLDSLQVGDDVGLYVKELPARQHPEGIALAVFVVRHPRGQGQEAGQPTLMELQARHRVAGLAFFPLVAGLIGLFVGAADGLICRLPRRALLCGTVGLVVGIVGGFVCGIVGDIAYAPLTELARRQSREAYFGLSTLGFVIQVFGRTLAWGLAGVAMGLGQGIALRSKRLLLYGLLGGVLGGLLGGMLFDPIDMILLGPDKPSARWSRLAGLGVIGASVGAMIGIVELLARDTWLRMTQGPLSGKEFILFKDVMNVGSSPRSDIYLFNDSLVAPDHAVIRTVGDESEIEARDGLHPVLLNNNPVRRGRLRHGDTVGIGRTTFVFQRRRG